MVVGKTIIIIMADITMYYIIVMYSTVVVSGILNEKYVI